MPPPCFLISPGEGSVILVLRLPLARRWCAALCAPWWEILVCWSRCWILLRGTKSPGRVCTACGTGVGYQELRSRLLECAVPSCEWKRRAQEFAEGSAPWLSNSSSAPGWALDLCIGIARDEHGGVRGLPVPLSHFLPCPWWEGAQKWKPSSQCIINSSDKIVREGVKWDIGGETLCIVCAGTFFNTEMAQWAVSREIPAVSYYVFRKYTFE